MCSNVLIGVDLFNKFIDPSSDFNVQDFVSEIISALERLPDVVSQLIVSLLCQTIIYLIFRS